MMITTAPYMIAYAIRADVLDRARPGAKSGPWPWLPSAERGEGLLGRAQPAAGEISSGLLETAPELADHRGMPESLILHHLPECCYLVLELSDAFLGVHITQDSKAAGSPSIRTKETNESCLWLRLCEVGNNQDLENGRHSLFSEAGELRNIFPSILAKSK